jgi:hypothetical protein
MTLMKFHLIHLIENTLLISGMIVAIEEYKMQKAIAATADCLKERVMRSIINVAVMWQEVLENGNYCLDCLKDARLVQFRN